MKNWYSLFLYTSPKSWVEKDKKARIFLWAFYDPNKKTATHGDTTETLITWLCKRERSNKLVYLYDMELCGHYIFDGLNKAGYKITDGDHIGGKTYTIMYGKGGQWSEMNIYMESRGKSRRRSVTIREYKNKVNLDICDLARKFKTEYPYIDIDIHKYRSKKHIPTQNEVESVKNNAINMGISLSYFYEMSLQRKTYAADAWEFYTRDISKSELKTNFPELDIATDERIRKTFRGGFVFVNPQYINKCIGRGYVLDINSLYAWAMRNKPMPIGQPIQYAGEPPANKLYIHTFSCLYNLKPNMLPTYQEDREVLYSTKEWSYSSNGKIIELSMTKPDYELFIKHYDIKFLDHVGGVCFESSTELFKNFVDYWYNIKCQEDIESGYRNISKSMLVALCGYFGKSVFLRSYLAALNGSKRLEKVSSSKNTVKPVYVPIAAFVTAYSRQKIITDAQKAYNDGIYAYSDTDSLHILGDDIPEYIELDAKKLGAYKIEKKFNRARYIHEKMYALECDGKTEIKLQGITKTAHKNIAFDDFAAGIELEQEHGVIPCKGGAYREYTKIVIRNEREN